MAPPRRSGRARNPTEDEASSAAEASMPSVDTSPRKRKRGAASPSTSDASASQSVDVTPTKPSADAVAPEVNVNGGSSSGQRGTEKKVGRPPKHNKVNEESTNGINGATATASGSKAGLQSLEAAGADETSVLTSAEELWLEKADADKLKAVLERRVQCRTARQSIDDDTGKHTDLSPSSCLFTASSLTCWPCHYHQGATFAARRPTRAKLRSSHRLLPISSMR